MTKDIFVVKESILSVSRVCNLKCKLCVADAPYETDAYFPNPNELIQYIDKYFSIVDYVEKFALTGGEPLLYPYLNDILDYLLMYSERIGRLEITTNGTIVPNDHIISTVKKFKDSFYRFLIDDYGGNLSINANKIAEKLSKNKLPYQLRDYHSEKAHFGGWVDFGNLDRIINSPQKARDIFNKCAYHNTGYCFIIYNGKMCPCGMVRRRLFKKQSVDYSEYIDLMDENLTVQEQQKKIKLIYENVVGFESCLYCKGMCADSPRFKPAEQLTKDEFEQIRMKK